MKKILYYFLPVASMLLPAACTTEVSVEYTYKGADKTATAERPTQFQPRAGVRYTAQLNFVGETFALNFIAADNEFWEDGGDSDVSIQ